MARERGVHGGRNGEEPGRDPRDDDEGEGHEPVTGFESKRSDRIEGWNERWAPRGSEWGWADDDTGERYGSLRPGRGAGGRHAPPWEAPEYGGREARPARLPHFDPRRHIYPTAEPSFFDRERTGYQREPHESGLGMRHREHVVGPGPEEERRHVGKGPKGYRRSDARIWEDVCERLARAGDVDATDIEVTVSDGEVTLEGFVETRREKRAAEDIAEDVTGVVDVHNRLKVKRPSRI